jgi:hypothetical protein
MITEGVEGKIVTASFSLLEWKVLHSILTAICTADRAQLERVLPVQIEITNIMEAAGFSSPQYPWLAIAFAAEVELRQLATQVVGPERIQQFMEETIRKQAEQEIADGAAIN